MCVTAAYRPVRELLNKLKKDKEAAKATGQDPAGVVPQGVRPLSMDDLRKAREQVGARPPGTLFVRWFGRFVWDQAQP